MIHALVPLDKNGHHITSVWDHLLFTDDGVRALDLKIRLDMEMRHWACDNNMDERIVHNDYAWVKISDIDLMQRKLELKSQLSVIELFEFGEAE